MEVVKESGCICRAWKSKASEDADGAFDENRGIMKIMIPAMRSWKMAVPKNKEEEEGAVGGEDPWTTFATAGEAGFCFGARGFRFFVPIFGRDTTIVIPRKSMCAFVFSRSPRYKSSRLAKGEL